MFRRVDITITLITSLLIHAGFLLLGNFSPKVEAKQLPQEKLSITLTEIQEHSEQVKLPKPVKAEPKKLVKKEPAVKPEINKQVVKKKVEATKEVLSEAPVVATQEVTVNEMEFAQSDKIRANYEQLVAQWLERHLRYPRIARRRGHQGQGTIELMLRPDGRVGQVKIHQSTGKLLLDEEMLSMVKRAEPFPKFPQNYPQQALTLQAPIRFELR